jgi:uncharacterized Zn-binding protein involved in type VI secretion
MSGIARLGDNISHGGNITSASSDIMVDGRGAARIGDQINCQQHGPGTITGGSSDIQSDGRGLARVGDQCSCGAVITGGASDSIGS